MKTALLIPTYQPKKNVLPFLRSFKGDEFDLFLLVDDGSGEEYAEDIRAIDLSTPFQVLSYPVNKGKGGALKTGIAELLHREDAPDVIVTADSDGQHLYEDILRVRDEALAHPEALVLGTRNFSLKDVPFRSKAGNRISSFYVHLRTGQRLDDTQTGLRAIPSRLYSLALGIEGNRYDYEFNFLIDAMKEAELRTIEISTVYENNNEGSHFHAIRDSARVYKSFLVQVLLTVACFFADIGLFALVYEALSPSHSGKLAAIAFAAVLAKLVAGGAYVLGVTYLATPNKNGRVHKALRYAIIMGIVLAMEVSWTFAISGRNFDTVHAVMATKAILAGLAYVAARLFRMIQRRERHESQVTAYRLDRGRRD